MRINNNIMALNAHRQLGANQSASAKSMEKLSSGLRINRAGDDAAGLAISEKMRGQIRGLKQASRNAQDGISMIQTAEGALNETHAILQRMRELATQSANDTNTPSDRAEIQKEIDQLAKEITRISNTTEFNTQNLLAGGLDNKFHIGANEGQNVGINIGPMDAKSLGVAANLVVYGLEGALTGISSVNNPSADLTGYKVATLAKVDATVSAATKSDGSIGDLIVTDPTAYDGAIDKNITIRIDNVDGTGKVTAASVSYDGGQNYSAITGLDSSGANATVVVDGLELTLTTKAENVKDATWTLNATAEYKNVQLQDSTDAAVGGVTKVYNNQTSASIGIGDKVVTVGFDYATLAADAQTDTITSTVTESKAAELVNGVINKEAVTHKGIDVSSQAAADAAITTINTAIETVSAERSKLGAYQNRLEHTISNLGTSAENLQAAESRIRDLDMAEEIMAFTKNNILQQAATAMLAQANMAPQSVLQLLG